MPTTGIGAVLAREQNDRWPLVLGIARPAAGGGPVRPFLIGTAVGGVAGAVAGALLSQRTRRLLRGLIHLAGRPLSDAEREKLRFELLLQ
ncbi:MAG: hypothetical protein M3Q10_06615 [Chloroflexota bacterium]|nr:hypothetical protein [Chloroflexota bacterium]